MLLIKAIRRFGYKGNIEITDGIQVFGDENGGGLSTSFGIQVSVNAEDNVDLDDFSIKVGEFCRRIERVSTAIISDGGDSIQMSLKKDDDQTFDGFLVFAKAPAMESNYQGEINSQFRILTSSKTWHLSLVNQMVAILNEGDWIELAGKRVSVKDQNLVIE